jgi:DNA repair protein RadA/Sms
VKWQGQCPGCSEWNTLDEVVVQAGTKGRGLGGVAVHAPGAQPPQPMGDIDVEGWHPRPTGVPEFDRVLGGGLVEGSVTLVGGEPGVGKSTLVLQVAIAVAAQGRRVLYLSGEESAAQVRHRSERLGAIPDELWLAPETSLTGALAAIDLVQPELLIVDSVQTLADPALGGVPGSVTQVREVAARLVAEAKSRPLAIVLVGHVTKDGSLAGPRVLEHTVDTVLAFEGDGHHLLRLLRAVKHRFGATDELGVFEMSGSGLGGVADPSALFLADRVCGLPGSAVLPTLEGHRPLLVEVQALTDPSQLGSPRRSAQGLDHGRLGLLLAVLDRRAGVPLHHHDVYALAVGGAKVSEPGADLAVALAVASARSERALPPDLVACAEVGLAGELRRVAHLERRLSEAARMGFGRALVPIGSPVPEGIEGVPVASLRDALAAVGIDPAAISDTPSAIGPSRQNGSPGPRLAR